MEILGYGEDALSLHFLKNEANMKKHLYLSKIETIFYRPSFGRGVSCYGEFDFIVGGISGNLKKVCLGESKWDGFGKYASILIDEDQLERHSAFVKLILGETKPPVDSELSTTFNDLVAKMKIDAKVIIDNFLIIFSFKDEKPIRLKNAKEKIDDHEFKKQFGFEVIRLPYENYLQNRFVPINK
ncbi:MAG: hypothetical protein AABZ39_14105 [Spirochaetota bacterium]